MSNEEMIQALNQDLAAELGTVIRYAYQSAHAVGLNGMELRELFLEEIQDELGHAVFLMDAIVDLGGEPTTTPKPFDQGSNLKAMLETDLRMELQDVQAYVAHAKMADEQGLIELKFKLEEMAADEAGHARELRRILKGL